MSSPNINNLILIGCMTMYCTVFMQERNPGTGNIFCIMRILTMTTGFSLVFGSLFSKTWRIHKILTSSTKGYKKVIIKDSMLIGLIVGLVGVNGVIILIWQVIDPLEVKLVNLTADVSPEDILNDIQIQSQISQCLSKYDTYFSGTLYAIQGLMLIFGAFIAWETRKVKVEALNDSRYIAMCIYNVTIFSLLGVAINLVLTTQPQAAYGFSCGFLLVGITLVQTILFIPKVLAVRANKDHIGMMTENSVSAEGNSTSKY